MCLFKTKILFSNKEAEGYSDKYTITFYKDKIGYFIGTHPIIKHSDRLEYQPKEDRLLLNGDFELIELSKLDKDLLGYYNATHKIVSKEVSNAIHAFKPMLVKLNMLQVFYIKWYKQEYVIQNIAFKTNALSTIIGAIIGAILTAIFVCQN